MRWLLFAAGLIVLFVWDLSANHAAYTKEISQLGNYWGGLLWQLIP